MDMVQDLLKGPRGALLQSTGWLADVELKANTYRIINYNCFSISVVAEYEFGIASLVNKKELLQVGDPVQFQLHVGEDFAVNIQATREKLRSYVEAMKGEFMLLQHKVLIYKFLENILHE